MDVDRDTMIRMLRGELDAADEAAAREAVAASPALKSELERLRKLDGILMSSAADSFGPYFSERVIRSITSAAKENKISFYDSLQWVFLRLATACLLVVIGLGTYNALQGQDLETSGSTVEAIFGLPSTDLESLYYLQGI